MNVGVFCSASDLAEKYVVPARELAKLIAEHGHSLVWGGSNTGVMKVMADGVQAGGGKIFGVSVEILKERARPDADEMVFAKDLGERKAMLLARSDVIVVLPGGLGTLDELSEILELRKHNAHSKRVVVLSTDGFIERPLSEFIGYAETPEAALALAERR